VFLAIDTSAGTSVAVIAPDGRILAEVGTPDTMRHAEVIGTMITDALAEAMVSARELTAVIAGMGPGPFTGLRVGIAAARVFALGAGIPLMPMVSHDAVAWQQKAAGATGKIMVVTDARRKEVFFSDYDLDAALPHREFGPALAKPDALPRPEVRRVVAAEIPAGSLGAAAADLAAAGLPLAADEALYLRSPDVTMPTGVKRVTQ
jgi:tRNA threonylcarbamoyl adenosine modification protein YeaZ